MSRPQLTSPFDRGKSALALAVSLAGALALGCATSANSRAGNSDDVAAALARFASRWPRRP